VYCEEFWIFYPRRIAIPHDLLPRLLLELANGSSADYLHITLSTTVLPDLRSLKNTKAYLPVKRNHRRAALVTRSAQNRFQQLLASALNMATDAACPVPQFARIRDLVFRTHRETDQSYHVAMAVSALVYCATFIDHSSGPGRASVCRVCVCLDTNFWTKWPTI